MSLRASDLLYSPGYNSGPTRARSILTIHDLIHLDDPEQASTAKRLYYELIVKPTVKKAGIALTVSEASRVRIAEWINDDAVEIRVVGNGSSDAFSPGAASDAPRDPHFVYVGNLRPHKNVPVLLEALARRREYRMTMVVADVADAHALAARYDVSAQVDVVTGIDDPALAELYRNATATLFPSRLEGFGFPALESYLCGTPVVYWAGCASIAEISGDSGIAVDELASGEAWAAALDEAVENRAALLRAPAAEWRKRFNWDAVARRVENSLVHA
jgi:glycosyltransferase involved in cell wall biosynthesis